MQSQGRVHKISLIYHHKKEGFWNQEQKKTEDPGWRKSKGRNRQTKAARLSMWKDMRCCPGGADSSTGICTMAYRYVRTQDLLQYPHADGMGFECRSRIDRRLETFDSAQKDVDTVHWLCTVRFSASA